MSLSSLQLDAFLAVSRSGSFSGAAKTLFVTQSALSQRILNLEERLGATLFVREPSGIRLTELGKKLLRYCQTKESLEAELLEDLGDPGGIIKIAGFSTVVRSVLIPALKTLLSERAHLQLELQTREVRELPGLLETGQADFIVTNQRHEKQGLVNLELGFEENVLVEPKFGKFREDIFLDHDSDDSTTAEFFKIQPRTPKNLRRSYFDEIYAIIDGVLAGAGRAVVPLHLVRQIKGLRVVKGYRPLKTPVVLCYYQQGFYTALQKRVMEDIQLASPEILS